MARSFNYTFTEQVGPEQYSEQTDEYFYDTDDFDWDYEPTEEQIANALLEICGKKEHTLEQNVKAVIDELADEHAIKEMLELDNSNTIEEAIEKAKVEVSKVSGKVDTYKLLEYLLGDIWFYTDKCEDELTDYFYEYAREDFLENY